MHINDPLRARALRFNDWSRAIEHATNVKAKDEGCQRLIQELMPLIPYGDELLGKITQWQEGRISSHEMAKTINAFVAPYWR